ncbi:COX15/CtaA family protein [Dongia deserti]|uniref:COX15/CtaA family protein n=1 Tax=Dongia deserti TaxID=2268030 RepID=UPI0025471DCB|nr:COX15/CtaA family protein [Dongia deserti]
MSYVQTAPIGATAARPATADRAVGLWLLALAGMVLVQVMLGAITRLTDSGLSIMEWQPIMGAIPPLNDAEWHRVFALYQQIAEYQQVNASMTLEGFKSIFWWEYVHRLWGRLIGVAFLLPFLWFWVRGQMRGRTKRLLAIFVLGGLQGLVGWIMVASGFADRTDVSQYRLVAHLLLALVIYAALLWSALDLLSPARVSMDHRLLRRHGRIMMAVITLEIAIGGFVAGLDGGFVYNNFPMMGDHWIAPDLFFQSPWWVNFFENPVTAQFLHRLVAGFVAIALISLVVRARRAELDEGLKRRFYYLPFGLLGQAALGIATLMLVVPLPLAVAHQAGGFILFSLGLYALHGLRRAKA